MECLFISVERGAGVIVFYFCDWVFLISVEIRPGGASLPLE